RGPRARVAVLYIELVRVMQREDRVDERPRQHDGDDREREVRRLAGGLLGAELGREGAESRERRAGGEDEELDAVFVEHRGPPADAGDVRLGHGLESEREIED